MCINYKKHFLKTSYIFYLTRSDILKNTHTYFPTPLWEPVKIHLTVTDA